MARLAAARHLDFLARGHTATGGWGSQVVSSWGASRVMCVRAVLGILAFAAIFLSPVAKAQGMPALACTPGMLDARVLPPMDPPTLNELQVLRDEQRLTMPFSVGTCAGVTISAWREGKYGGDPLNAAYEKTVEKGPEGPVPAQCPRDDFSKLGRPVMLQPSGGLRFGLSVSTEKIPLGQPVTLHLWIDNPTDKEASVATCTTLDFFWAEQFDLYDAYGHRVVKKRELQQRKKPVLAPPGGPNQDCTGFWECFRNFAIAIPAHTCLNGKAEQLQYDLNRNLLEYYDLPPGVYYVVPRTSKMEGNFCREVVPKVDPATLRDKLRICIGQN